MNRTDLGHKRWGVLLNFFVLNYVDIIFAAKLFLSEVKIGRKATEINENSLFVCFMVFTKRSIIERGVFPLI